VLKNFTSQHCGQGRPIGLGYHRFQKPNWKACDNVLNFSSGVSSNTLHSGGALVYANVLPDTDLSVTADKFEWPVKDRTGEMDGFAILNLKTGTNSTFTFTFKKHGTDQNVLVKDFIVTIAELTTSRKCWNKAYVTAQDFTGYFLTNTPKLDVKAFPGNEEESPYVTFMASHMEGGRPRNATIAKRRHRDSSVSLYYRSTESFQLQVQTLDPMWKGGAYLRLGGQSLVTCQSK